MSALSISQGATALGAGLITGFVGVGGTSPYSYAVQPNGAGGSINSSGVYTAPSVVSNNPEQAYDTIVVTDSSSPTAQMATATVLVGTALQLFCDVIQNQLGLANGRVWIFNQKEFMPTDSGLYVPVVVTAVKPFGNVNTFLGSNETAQQSLTCNALLDVHVISRDLSALNRKEEVVMAFVSNYAQSQGEANSFSIARLPTSFTMMPTQDGAAIPYHFVTSVQMTYSVPKVVSVPYISSITQPEQYINP